MSIVCKQPIIRKSPFATAKLLFFSEMAKQKQKYYVVWVGREQGIFTDWETCKAQVQGFEGAKYKSFPTKEEAQNAFMANPEDSIGKNNNKKLWHQIVPSRSKLSIQASLLMLHVVETPE